MSDLSSNKPLRRLRSYVRREGRMTAGQQRAWQNYWPVYGLSLQAGMLNLPEIFKRTAPCILEIGFGMGHSLAAQAQQNPERNFIGIEVHRPGIGSLLALLAEQNITNVRVFCADAVEILNHCIPDASLTGIQIFFPDPWPKRRHHKRRLIQPEFVEVVTKKLQDYGFLHCATDWEDYAQQMLEVLNNTKSLQNSIIDNTFAARPATRPLTKFEQRGQRLGHGVWDLVFSKR